MSVSRSSTLLIFLSLACASEEGTNTAMTPALVGEGSPSASADGSNTTTASGTNSAAAGGGTTNAGAGQAGSSGGTTSTSTASTPATGSTSLPMNDAAGAGGAGGGVTLEPMPSGSGTNDGAGLGGSMDQGGGGAGGAGPGMQGGGAGGMGMEAPELGGMGGMPDDGMTDDGMTDDGMTDDGMTDDGMTDDGMTDDGMADDGMADDGMMTDDGMAGGDSCVKGSTAGNEVVFIGESFIAASSIAQETTNLARANGSLEQGESYLNASVSGTRMGDGAIPRQYTQTAASNPIRFVLMNGGGNDCLQANDPNAPIPAAEALYAEMAADGVEKVVYFFYPDAAGAFGGPGSSLQTCLEEYRPKIKALCDGLTAPKCYWLDLAETEWDGNESAFTSDGIHPNAEGSRVTAQAIWDVMVENCVAQ